VGEKKSRGQCSSKLIYLKWDCFMKNNKTATILHSFYSSKSPQMKVGGQGVKSRGVSEEGKRRLVSLRGNIKVIK